MLDFEDTAEFENATKGLIASPDTLDIYDENGKLVWSQTAYAFLDQEAPDTANPSLWRDTQLNHIYGLFEVTDEIYQVRGYDMSNVTFIKGDTGWIVVDPLMSMECAAAAFSLVEENLGTFPVKAVIYSHSHVDHFGGVIFQEQSGDVNPLHAVSDIYAGTAMGRRASYQYGTMLEASETGALAIGIGMSGATSYFLLPQKPLIIDGVEIEFQLTRVLNTGGMNFWIGSKNALWMAENCIVTTPQSP